MAKLTKEALLEMRGRSDIDFGDPKIELERIRQEQTLRRQVRTHYSKLDRYASQLLDLENSGASISEMHVWLELQGVQCARSTVHRWIIKHGKKQESEEHSS